MCEIEIVVGSYRDRLQSYTDREIQRKGKRELSVCVFVCERDSLSIRPCSMLPG